MDSAVLETWAGRRGLKKKYLSFSSLFLLFLWDGRAMVLPSNQQHKVKVDFSKVIIASHNRIDV